MNASMLSSPPLGLQSASAILEVLVVSDQSVQDIATTLFLSRSTLYRHISSINKKAGTASRVALINFFWSWTPKD